MLYYVTLWKRKWIATALVITHRDIESFACIARLLIHSFAITPFSLLFATTLLAPNQVTEKQRTLYASLQRKCVKMCVCVRKCACKYTLDGLYVCI